jgi:ParB-like chromosome segregation protein Spo0J
MAETMIAISDIGELTDVLGRPINPRGARFTYADVQQSILEHGQTTPLIVYEAAESERVRPVYASSESARAAYVLIDGRRRLAALHALGVSHARANVVSRPESPEADMLACFVRQGPKPLPLARALRRMLDAGHTMRHISRLTALSVELVSLYTSLLDAPEPLQAAVENGTLSIWAWKALRDKPRDVQERALTLKPRDGKITVRRVRQYARKALGGGQGDATETEENLQRGASDVRRTVQHHVAAIRRLAIQARIVGDASTLLAISIGLRAASAAVDDALEALSIEPVGDQQEIE